jgi:hypothetical protein
MTHNPRPEAVINLAKKREEGLVRFSRSLCLPPDEAEAEHEHPKGQQYCTDVGEM